MVVLPGYHQRVKIPWFAVVGWYHAALLGALVWAAAWRPAWAPVMVAAALVVHRLVDRSRAAEPWSSAAVALSSLLFLFLRGGWEVAAGWLLLAALVAAVAHTLPRRDGVRPDAADFLAVGGWGVVFVLAPRLVGFEHGGWLAPALLWRVTQSFGKENAQ